MASGKQGILGALSGRVANVVCSSWKGIAVFKSLPASVANPRTVAQIAQRTKMAYVVLFASKINTALIKPLWDRFQSQKSGYNAFVQANISLFEDMVPYPPNQLILSKGKMIATPITSIVPTGSPYEINVHFESDLTDSYQQNSDKVYLVGMCEQTGELAFSAGVASRVNGVALLTFNNVFPPNATVHAWLAFKREDGTIVSDSAYYLSQR